MLVECIDCGNVGAHIYFDHGDDGPYCATCANKQVTQPSGAKPNADPEPAPQA